MDGKRLKFVLLGSGIVLSMALLLWAATSKQGGLVYYLSVTEFMEQERATTDGFRVAGKVVEGTIERDSGGQDVYFVMSDGASDLRVHYRGIIPDTFVDGAEVVVEGSLDGKETLEAHMMLAKCPSKYESADDADGAAGRAGDQV